MAPFCSCCSKLLIPSSYDCAISVIQMHLCIRTTCLQRPLSLGPLSGRYRQVLLYSIFNAASCLSSSLYLSVLVGCCCGCRVEHLHSPHSGSTGQRDSWVPRRPSCGGVFPGTPSPRTHASVQLPCPGELRGIPSC